MKTINNTSVSALVKTLNVSVQELQNSLDEFIFRQMPRNPMDLDKFILDLNTLFPEISRTIKLSIEKNYEKKFGTKLIL